MNFIFFTRRWLARYFRGVSMNHTYRNQRRQWFKESLALHHATSAEISKQLNFNTTHSDLDQERVMQAFKTIEELDFFLTAPTEVQAHYPKTYQRLFRSLDKLHVDPLITQFFSDKWHEDSFLSDRH